MTREVKKFLDNVQINFPTEYLRFYRFYVRPELALGGSEEETLDEYYKYGDIKHFVLNPLFFEFLSVLQNDWDFYSKLNYNLLRKMKFILYDSKEYKEKYMPDLEKSDFQEMLLGKVPVSTFYLEKYKILYFLSERFKKQKWLYDLKVPCEVVESLDIELINRLMSDIQIKIDLQYVVEIGPIEERKSIYNHIKSDNYSEPSNCFLYQRGGYDSKVFKNLVCDNEFLNIVETILLPQELSKVIIEHIIEILTVSIDFKCLKIDKYDGFYMYYDELGKEKIKSFDYKKASKLITILRSKLNSHKQKIIIIKRNSQE